MYNRKVSLFALIIIIISFTCCEKEDEYKPYLEDGFIEFTASGKSTNYITNDSYLFNNQYSFSTFKNYSESGFRMFSPNERRLQIVRYSNDYTSYVSFSLFFDSLYNYTGLLNFKFELNIKKDNTVIYYSGSTYGQDEQESIYVSLTDISYDKKNKRLTGKFYYHNISSQYSNINLEGNFDVIVYELL